MDLNEVFRPACIDLEMDAKNKEEVLSNLADLLLKDKAITSTKEYLKAVYKREAEAPTGIGNLIAIPHGKSSCILKTSVAYARLKKSIQWESCDNSPVKYVFLLAVPEENRNVNQIKLLSHIARILAQDDILGKLEKLNTVKEVIELFINENLD